MAGMVKDTVDKKALNFSHPDKSGSLKVLIADDIELITVTVLPANPAKEPRASEAFTICFGSKDFID